MNTCEVTKERELEEQFTFMRNNINTIATHVQRLHQANCRLDPGQMSEPETEKGVESAPAGLLGEAQFINTQLNIIRAELETELNKLEKVI